MAVADKPKVPPAGAPGIRGLSSTQKWNIACNLGDGLGWWLGIGLVSPATILPLFVSHLTDSNILLGIIPAFIAIAFAMPQLISAGYIQNLHEMKPFIVWTAFAGRIAFLALVIAIWLFAATNPTLMLVLFFLLFGFFRAVGGANMPAWSELIAKVIPNYIRGRFFSITQGVGGGLGAIGIFLAGVLLDRYPFPANFVAIFAGAFVFTSLSLFSLSRVKEPVTTRPVTQNRSITKQLLGVPALLRADANFRHFLGARVILVVGQLALAFFTVYGVRNWGADAQTVSTFTAILLVAQTVGAFTMGFIGDHFGSKRVLELGGLFMAGAGLLGFLAGVTSLLVILSLSFVMIGLATAAFTLGDPNIMIDFGARGNRPIYVAVANSLLAPSLLVAALFGGWLADVFGYESTFVATILINVLGLVAMIVAVKDPGGQT